MSAALRLEAIEKINETFTSTVGRSKALKVLESLVPDVAVPEYSRGQIYKNGNGKVMIVYYSKNGVVRAMNTSGGRTKKRTPEEFLEFLSGFGYELIAGSPGEASIAAK